MAKFPQNLLNCTHFGFIDETKLFTQDDKNEKRWFGSLCETRIKWNEKKLGRKNSFIQAINTHFKSWRKTLYRA